VLGPVAQALAAPQLAQIAAVSKLKEIAIGSADANTEASVAQQIAQDQSNLASTTASANQAAAAVPAGAVGLIILLISLTLAAISAAQQGSSDSQNVENFLQEILALDKNNYWGQKTDFVGNHWNSGQAGIGVDLNAVANEGTDGYDVQNGPDPLVYHFYEHSSGFILIFIPGQPGVPDFWHHELFGDQIPWSEFIPSPGFLTSGQSNLLPLGGIGSSDLNASLSWYGAVPLPSAEGSPDNIIDPTTFMPVFLQGIQSYLSANALRNIIDPNEPTFDVFINTHQYDLKNLAHRTK
jgi:hypothetical protein